MLEGLVLLCLVGLALCAAAWAWLKVRQHLWASNPKLALKCSETAPKLAFWAVTLLVMLGVLNGWFVALVIL